MNSLFIILTILIILSILYLYYKNKNYKERSESFVSTTQNSLSTYYHNTVDNNKFQNNRNIYNGVKIQSFRHFQWNGTWENDSLNIKASFIQLNDKLLIGLGHSSLEKYLNNPATEFCFEEPNTFIGIGQLNKRRNIFQLVKVIMNSYLSKDLTLTEYGLSGEINRNKIKLFSNKKSSKIELYRVSKLTFDLSSTRKHKFLTRINKYFTRYPIMKDNRIDLKMYYCEDSTPCKITDQGLGDAFNGRNFNACGERTSYKNNQCKDKPKCVFYEPAPKGFITCNYRLDTDASLKGIKDRINFAAINTMHESTKHTLNHCDYLEYFGKSGFNSVILCYVTKLGHVQTLNYQYFGVLPEESSLTIQSDIMNKLLNLPEGILETQRRIMVLNNVRIGTHDIHKALSFTNCVESNRRANTVEKMEDICKYKYINYINSYKESPTNEKLMPAVWSINYKIDKNFTNSCNFILSTSALYNTPVKYAEFNNNGTTNLSLYGGGGSKQNLMFENSKVIDHSPGNFVFMTANIKANNGLYLIPSMEKTGFSNNSGIINLESKPSEDSKWMIIGLQLKSIDNLDVYTDLHNMITNFSKKIQTNPSGTILPIQKKI